MIPVTSHQFGTDKESGQGGYKYDSHGNKVTLEQAAERCVGKGNQNQYKPFTFTWFADNFVIATLELAERQMFVICFPTQRAEC